MVNRLERFGFNRQPSNKSSVDMAKLAGGLLTYLQKEGLSAGEIDMTLEAAKTTNYCQIMVSTAKQVLKGKTNGDA